MPLSYIVIGGWLCVIILFAVNVTHSLPGSTVGLMTGATRSPCPSQEALE
jgi:hypothetical protein